MGVGLAAGATLLGTTASVYGMYEQNEAANKTRDYNADVADRNAGYANEQAKLLDEQASYLQEQSGVAITEGQKEETNFRRNLSVFMGNQKATQSISGAVVNEGSFKQVTLDTARFGEEDAMTIRYNATKKAEAIQREATKTAREAGRYREMSSDYTTNADMLRKGKTDVTLPMIGSALNGVSSFANNLAYAVK